MTKRISVLIEIQDEDQYVLEAFTSYEKAVEAKKKMEEQYGDIHEYMIDECDLHEEKRQDD